jgi:metal-responsive CopG/Arc/MetJ family transcriptional regulator
MSVINFYRRAELEPPTSMRLSKEVLQRLDEIAARHGRCSRTSLIRRAVEEFVAANSPVLQEEDVA